MLVRPATPPGMVSRPGLSDQIRGVPPGSTSLICAAPGYGATTAVLDAVSGEPAVWLRWHHRPDPTLTRQLLAVGDRAGWIVLDGLPDDDHLLAEVAAVAISLPDSQRLVITAHHEMPALLRACGQRLALHLGETDLAMRDDDALRLLQAVCPGLDIDMAARIIDVAEGWPAALTAAAVHARQHPQADWLGTQGGDLLLTPWFEGLPADLREWLLATGVLDLLAAGVADTCTGSGESGQALQRLTFGHGFVQEVPAPAGHEGRWWRRHGLLTTYLRQHATALADRHKRAAEWFRQTGDVRTCLEHLVAAGELAGAAELLRAHEQDLLRAGEAERVTAWYHALVPDADAAAIDLLRQGWGLALSAQFGLARQTGARLDAVLAHSPPDPTDLPPGLDLQVEAHVLRAFLASAFADPATMITAGRQACAGITAPTTDGTQLAPLLVARGLLWSGREAGAATALAHLDPFSLPTDIVREVHATALRAHTAAVTGDLLVARSLGERCDDWLARGGLSCRSVADFTPELVRGWISYEAGELDAAHDHATATAATAAEMGHRGFEVMARAGIATAVAAQGELGAAVQALDAARECALLAMPGSGMLPVLEGTRARVLIMAGDDLRAARTIRDLPDSTRRSLLWAWLHVAKRPATAVKTLTTVRPDTPRAAAEQQLLLAAAQLGHNRHRAAEHLRKAAAIADRHGMGSLLFTCEPAVLELAEEVQLRDQDDALGGLLGTRARGVGRAAETGDAGQRFTGKELQLLALLPTRLTNADIAADLGLSVNTIKTRLRSIYAKLGAANRDEALAVARRRGLLR